MSGAATTDTAESHARQRSRALSANMVAGLAGRALNVVAGVFTVPLLLRALATDEYGVFQTITGISAWLQLGTLGLGKSLVNVLVAARVNGDSDRARTTVASFAAGLASLLFAISVGVALAFPFINWNAVFPSPTAQAPQVPGTVALTIAFSVTTLLTSPVGVILSAHQKERQAALWNSLRTAANLAALGAAVALGGGMPRVAFFTGLAGLVVNLTSVWWLFSHEEPGLRFKLRDVSGKELKAMLLGSIVFFAIDIAALLVFSLDRLLILHFSGPEEVAAFDVVTRLYVFGYGLFQVVLSPLWPAFSDALRRNDVAWARRVLRRVSLVAVAGATALTLGTTLVGDIVLSLWTGHDDLAFSRMLALGAGTFFIVRAVTDAHSVLLYGADRPGDVLRSAVVHGVLALTLGIVLGRASGALGVVIANVVAFAATAGWWVPLQAHRRLAAMARGAST